jgi:hypothetical protein
MWVTSYIPSRLIVLECLLYRVFRAQADWTLTHGSHKDTEQSTIEASITLDGVTLTESLIRRSPNEWTSVCREIPVSGDKRFWTSNQPAQWTLYSNTKAEITAFQWLVWRFRRKKCTVYAVRRPDSVLDVCSCSLSIPELSEYCDVWKTYRTTRNIIVSIALTS